MKTFIPKEGERNKKWYVIDAEGKVIGRVAVEAAKLLRGKHKPQYTPYLDCGDHVIIINAEKVRFTGKKMTDKDYVRYTGYQGGQRFTTPKELMAKKPTEILLHAIHGMLPKGRLGRELNTNVRVYAGTEHNHEAQQPKKVDLSKVS